MVVSDIGKLIVLLTVAIGLVIGLVTGTWSGEDAVPAWTLLGGIVGYLTGNGTLAVRNKAPSVTLVTNKPEESEP